MAPSSTRPPAVARGRAVPVRRRWRTFALLALAGLALLLNGALLWQATDGLGRSSSAQPIAILSTEDIHAVLWSPSAADTVFAGHHGGLLRSTDGGRTWQPTALAAADAMSLAAAPSAPERLYAAGHGVFLRSDDGGATWTAPATALAGADIHGFAQSPTDPDRLFALVVGQGLLMSTDGGATWEPRSPVVPNHAALAVTADGARLLMGSGAGVQESSDGGATWRASGAAMPQGGQILALALAPNGDVLFAASTEGLFRRSGRGTAWEQTALTGAVMAVAVSPLDPARVLAIDADKRVYRSDDGGTTWSRAAR